VLQNVPATAKQLAERLNSTPGAIGHHLKLLERHGLVQIVARRQVRGIVANYYARTGRMLNFSAPMLTEDLDRANILTTARDELAEMLAEDRDENEAEVFELAYPHVQLSAKNAARLGRRVKRLIDDLVAMPNEPGEPLYGVAVGLFRAPRYLQVASGDPEASGLRRQALDAGATPRRSPDPHRTTVDPKPLPRRANKRAPLSAGSAALPSPAGEGATPSALRPSRERFAPFTAPWRRGWGPQETRDTRRLTPSRSFQ